MKLTLTNIRQLKRDTENALTKRVCQYVIDEWENYDDKKHIFTDVLYYGCQSGTVGFLIWYSDRQGTFIAVWRLYKHLSTTIKPTILVLINFLINVQGFVQIMVIYGYLLLLIVNSTNGGIFGQNVAKYK